MNLPVLPSDQVHLYTHEIADAWHEFYKVTNDKQVSAKLVSATIESIKCDMFASIAKSLEDISKITPDLFDFMGDRA